MAFIYGLVDPRNDTIRYIGKAKNLQERYSRHFEPVQLAQKNHRANWLNSLLAIGMKPSMIIIEEVLDGNWQERERFWIIYYRQHGNDLTNGTDGGDGLHNPTPDVRYRIGLANRGRRASDETRQKISAALKNKPKTKEHNEKVAAAARGRKHSDESRRRMSEARAGRKFQSRFYRVRWPSGREDHIATLSDYCKSNGLSHPRMSSLLRGKLNYYRGMEVLDITREEYDLHSIGADVRKPD